MMKENKSLDSGNAKAEVTPYAKSIVVDGSYISTTGVIEWQGVETYTPCHSLSTGHTTDYFIMKFREFYRISWNN
jgi:hypothetical protein